VCVKVQPLEDFDARWLAKLFSTGAIVVFVLPCRLKY
jgi:hypothetical protein